MLTDEEKSFEQLTGEKSWSEAYKTAVSVALIGGAAFWVVAYFAWIWFF